MYGNSVYFFTDVATSKLVDFMPTLAAMEPYCMAGWVHGWTSGALGYHSDVPSHPSPLYLHGYVDGLCAGRLARTEGGQGGDDDDN